MTIPACAPIKRTKTGRGEAGRAGQVRVPEREAWLHNNTSAMESLQRGIKEAAAGDVHYLGSFAEFADVEIED